MIQLKSLYEWLSYLETAHPQQDIKLGLDRVKKVKDQLFALLNVKSKLAKCIVTVAGTNGKGSTVAVLEAIAKQGELNVGAYTSPHLLRVNERIRINGKLISDDNLCDSLNLVERARYDADVILTYFEYLTLSALAYFAQESIDIMLLEVGMGGRLDAVNCIDPDIAVITTIAMDHTNFLGNSLKKIAREKAGILRPNKPAIIGDKESIHLLEDFCKVSKCLTLLAGKHFDLQCNEDNDKLNFYTINKTLNKDTENIQSSVLKH